MGRGPILAHRSTTNLPVRPGQPSRGWVSSPGHTAQAHHSDGLVVPALPAASRPADTTMRVGGGHPGSILLVRGHGFSLCQAGGGDAFGGGNGGSAAALRTSGTVATCAGKVGVSSCMW
jgi:hypothetical protein